MADLTYPIFVGPGGSDPVKHILALADAVRPTVGDALDAGYALFMRIRRRTAAGVDVEGVPFAAYSETYRKRKIALLGHADTVDLFGAQHHTHMLNTIQVRCGGVSLMAGSAPSADPHAAATPANLFHLGFYNEEAARAKLHNEGGTFRTRLGTGKGKPKKNGKAEAVMPRRHFFDANSEDLELMGYAIRQRMLARAHSLGH